MRTTKTVSITLPQAGFTRAEELARSARDLLVLGSFHGIQVVTPAAFLGHLCER